MKRTARQIIKLSPLFLAACGSVQQAVDGNYDTNRDSVSAANAKFLTQNVTSGVPLVQKSTGAWLGAKALPLQADLTLPEVFRKKYVFQFPGKVNIETVAQRVTRVTGIPVRVKPDVLLPPTAFVSGGNQVNSAALRQTSTSPANGAPPNLPALPNPAAFASAPLNAGLSATGSAYAAAPEYEMNYEGTVTGFLDLLSARAGISWEYREGVISFHRLVTKVFTLKAIPGDSEFNSSIGKQGQTQTGSTGNGSVSQTTGGYSSNTTITMNSKFSVWDSVKAAIESVISPAGKFAISQASGMITVTDTRDVVEQVAKIIDQENGMNTRQVAMRVEVLTVKINKGEERGVDWDLVFNQVSNMVPWAVRFSSPASLVSSNAANLGVSILAPTNGAAMSASQARWGGSQAFFKALQNYGKVSVLTTANAVTLNRQPVPVAITSQTTYLAKITPAPAGASGSAGGTPGLEPGTVTTGFLLNLLPTVLDSNSILLQFGVGISDLTRLADVVSGQQKIQAPEVSSTDFLQKVALKPGETLVLSGYERASGQYDRRTLSEGAPIGIGGSVNGSNSREAVVILVTPVLSEGAV